MDTTATATTDKKPFDRAAHCQRIGAAGGRTTVERHGVFHMSAIGKAGAKTTIERHGVAYFKGITQAKGWNGPRRRDVGTQLKMDLAFGKTLAELAR